MTVRTALVVVPTYNELANLPVLTAGLMEQPNLRLLVVDDQSPDGTGRLAISSRGSTPAGSASCTGPVIGGWADPTSTVSGKRFANLRTSSARWTRICRTIRGQLPALIAAADESDVVIGSR